MPRISRRQFIAGTGTLAASSVVTGCFNPDQQAVVRPEDVPLGPFGAESTALEVTEGIDLTGKTALITGCNSGLGFETMRILSLRGANIIGAARTQEKAEEALAAINAQGKAVACELGDLASVAACGKTVRALGTAIDMLILNAGIMALPELEQINGIEKQFFVNHIGHFALTSYLLPQVIAAPQGRIVVVSSSGHEFAPEGGIDFTNLSGERDYAPWTAYGVSKLANGLFTLELTKRLAETQATANCIHPGIINTNLGRHFPWWQQLGASLFGWAFMKSIEEGAATQTYVATAPALAGYSGYYFADCNPLLPDPRMLNEQQAAELWAVSEQISTGYLA